MSTLQLAHQVHSMVQTAVGTSVATQQAHAHRIRSTLSQLSQCRTYKYKHVWRRAAREARRRANKLAMVLALGDEEEEEEEEEEGDEDGGDKKKRPRLRESLDARIGKQQRRQERIRQLLQQQDEAQHEAKDARAAVEKRPGEEEVHKVRKGKVRGRRGQSADVRASVKRVQAPGVFKDMLTTAESLFAESEKRRVQLSNPDGRRRELRFGQGHQHVHAGPEQPAQFYLVVDVASADLVASEAGQVVEEVESAAAVAADVVLKLTVHSGSGARLFADTRRGVSSKRHEWALNASARTGAHMLIISQRDLHAASPSDGQGHVLYVSVCATETRDTVFSLSAKHASARTAHEERNSSSVGNDGPSQQEPRQQSVQARMVALKANPLYMRSLPSRLRKLHQQRKAERRQLRQQHGRDFVKDNVKRVRAESGGGESAAASPRGPYVSPLRSQRARQRARNQGRGDVDLNASLVAGNAWCQREDMPEDWVGPAFVSRVSARSRPTSQLDTQLYNVSSFNRYRTRQDLSKLVANRSLDMRLFSTRQAKRREKEAKEGKEGKEGEEEAEKPKRRRPRSRHERALEAAKRREAEVRRKDEALATADVAMHGLQSMREEWERMVDEAAGLERLRQLRPVDDEEEENFPSKEEPRSVSIPALDLSAVAPKSMRQGYLSHRQQHLHGVVEELETHRSVVSARREAELQRRPGRRRMRRFGRGARVISALESSRSQLRNNIGLVLNPLY